MLLAYLLLFLLSLSASACDATGRNHLLLLHVNHSADVVPAPSPVTHDHRRIAKDLSYHMHCSVMMARRGGPSPAVVEVSGVEGVGPPEEEIRPAMAPSPSPLLSWQVHGGGYEEAGGGDVGGGEGGWSSEVTATAQEDRRTDDVGVDYAPPKTHPPSHH